MAQVPDILRPTDSRTVVCRALTGVPSRKRDETVMSLLQLPERPPYGRPRAAKLLEHTAPESAESPNDASRIPKKPADKGFH